MKLILGLILMSSFFASLTSASELTTVPSVDLDRYQGKWFEIASIPQYFQRKCVANTTAEYEIIPNSDGEVRINNSCETKDGDRIRSEGRARVVDKKTNSKLEVTFVNIGSMYFYLLGGKYWIINLAEDYSYVVVGHPKLEYGWILARSPSLPSETLNALSEFIKNQGYDLCQFMTSPQKGGIEVKRSLCEK